MFLVDPTGSGVHSRCSPISLSVCPCDFEENCMECLKYTIKEFTFDTIFFIIMSK